MIMNCDSKVSRRCFKNPRFAIARAIASATGRNEREITDQDELPTDRLSVFARVNRFQPVFLIDVINARTAGDLARTILAKRGIPHSLSI